MTLKFSTCITYLLLLFSFSAYAAEDGAANGNNQESTDASVPTFLYVDTKKGGSKDWSSYLADTSQANISAAGLLGISGESITTVENLRDLVVSLKGLDNNGDKATLAIAVNPGRTGISPIGLADYARSPLMRLLANTTFAYAQGGTEISDISFERRAVSVETSATLFAEDDIVVAFPRAVAKAETEGCKNILDSAYTAAMQYRVKQQGDSRSVHDMSAEELGALKAQVKTLPLGGIQAQDITTALSEKDKADLNEKSKTCYDTVKEKLRWNVSRVSLVYGQGWIKQKDSDGGDDSLGRTFAASISYGLDGTRDVLSDHVLLSATYRKTQNEPVLETLTTGAKTDRDTSLLSGRVTVGGSKIRAVVEGSDADSKEVTASQRAYKLALGIDFRLREALWINLRAGRQRSINGDSNETGSLLSISYSPSALLN